MTRNGSVRVFARMGDAPPGVKGLSVFAVAKKLINADGSVGEANHVSTVSVEHKLGIHGSPTCVMAFENSFGYLVGELHNGLACMFTMMNHARLSVGLEGVAISERAYQQALTYARDHSVADGLDQIATWNGGMLRPEDLMKALQAKMTKQTALFADLLNDAG